VRVQDLLPYKTTDKIIVPYIILKSVFGGRETKCPE
jgi:hypothetical protein